MIDYSILNIPTVLNPPFILKDIIYNCPVCDYEIDMILNNNSFIRCENCDHKIKLKIITI